MTDSDFTCGFSSCVSDDRCVCINVNWSAAVSSAFLAANGECGTIADPYNQFRALGKPTINVLAKYQSSKGHNKFDNRIPINVHIHLIDQIDDLIRTFTKYLLRF
jgi:hypothetical protein